MTSKPDTRPSVPFTCTWLLATALALTACAGTGDTSSDDATDESEAASTSTTDTQSSRNDDDGDNGDADDDAEAERSGVSEDELRPDHPVRYTVRRGDTLWDIAAKFLRDPWVWPEIWHVNPEITNPHLIYPGDVIRLVWVDDEARLRVERPDAEPGVRKLEPKIRRMALDEAIDTIPAEAIRSFLNEPRVVTPEQMEEAPYLLSARDDRVLMSEGDEVFARGVESDDFDRYMVFQEGEPLVDPDTDETLGWEAIHTGDVRIVEHGDPATVEITSNEREIRQGDRLLPIDDFIPPARYVPKVPQQSVDGRIIGLFEAISQVARNQVVVINRGERDGMEIGHVLRVERAGRTVEDPYSDDPGEEVELPAQGLGSLMIFRTFERVSYGLIMSSERPIRMHDAVTRP